MSDEPAQEVEETPIQEQWPLTLKQLEKRLLAKIAIKRDMEKSKMVFYLKIPHEETGAMVLNEVTRMSALDYNDLESKEITKLRHAIIKTWVEKSGVEVLPEEVEGE